MINFKLAVIQEELFIYYFAILDTISNIIIEMSPINTTTLQIDTPGADILVKLLIRCGANKMISNII